MLVEELREVCENLGRFAAIREKAPTPTDRILIQAAAGRLKFIAGDDSSTLIVDAAETKENGLAIVPARLLLSAAKSLKGKGEVDLTVGNTGVRLRFGAASVDLPIVGDNKVPSEWNRAPSTVVSSAPFPAGFLETLAKAVDGVEEKFGTGKYAYFEYADRLGFYALKHTLAVDARHGNAPLHAVFASFCKSVKGIDSAGIATHHGERMTSIKAGKYLAIHRSDLDNTPPLLPSVDQYSASVVVDRKPLLENLKMSSNGDEFGRVRLLAESETLTLFPKANEGAAIRMPATSDGRGSIWLAASLLEDAVRGLSGKKIRLSWNHDKTTPIKISDLDVSWSYHLAPVIL